MYKGHHCIFYAFQSFRSFIYLKSLPKDIFIDFRERKKEREREKHWCERETSIDCFPYTPRLGIKPATFWCTGWRPNQLSHLARARSSSLRGSPLHMVSPILETSHVNLHTSSIALCHFPTEDLKPWMFVWWACSSYILLSVRDRDSPRNKRLCQVTFDWIGNKSVKAQVSLSWHLFLFASPFQPSSCPSGLPCHACSLIRLAPHGSDLLYLPPDGPSLSLVSGSKL